MKRNPAIQPMITLARTAKRTLSVMAAATLLAALVPANVHAGDDGKATDTHAKRHVAARSRYARHMHYLSAPRVHVEAPDSAPVKRANDDDNNKPLDESLYRSFQENNLLNPG